MKQPNEEWKQPEGYGFAPPWDELQEAQRPKTGMEPLARQKNEEKEDISTSDDYTRQEIVLALRNHGHHPEGLKWDITPIGMHYLLTESCIR